jgi:hypothetical protein
MHIREYLEQPLSGVINRHGNESDWLDIGSIELLSGCLSIGDAALFPGDQAELDISPGNYLVQAKIMDYGIDRRICRLRAVLSGLSAERHHIGDISVDFGVIGVCDHSVFLAALEPFGKDLDEYNAVYGHKLDAKEGYGRIVLSEQPLVTMIFVRPGWGDGCYDVYQLLVDTRCIGVEAVFIEEDAGYLFEDVAEHDIV